MKHRRNPFNARNHRHVGHNIEPGADGHGVALPAELMAVRFADEQKVAEAFRAATHTHDFGLALDGATKVEGRDVFVKIADIHLRRHEIRSVQWESKVGKGRQIFGRHELCQVPEMSAMVFSERQGLGPRNANLGVFINSVNKGAANLVLCLEQTSLDGCYGEELMCRGQELECCEATWAAANDCNLHGCARRTNVGEEEDDVDEEEDNVDEEEDNVDQEEDNVDQGEMGVWW